MDKVSQRYQNLFRRIPGLISQMQEEIENLTNANNLLLSYLENVMKEKTAVGRNFAVP